MTPLKLPSGEYLLVEVPEDAKSFVITVVNRKWYYLSADMGDTFKDLGRIPKGKWEEVGKGSEISEKEWEVILPGQNIQKTPFYTNFLNKKGYFNSATESGHSLIASHNYTPGQVVLLKKQA